MKKTSSSALFLVLLSAAFVIMFFSAFLLTRFSSFSQAQPANPTAAPRTQSLPAVRTTPTALSPTPVPTPDATPTSVPVVTKLAYPAKGTLTRPFAADTLVYSESTGDWRTHNGIDIAGEQTDVLAAADGIVTEQSENGPLGNCIVIDHNGGLQTRYYGMEKMYTAVQQSVTQGEPIGRTGTAAPDEGTEGYHLHFEVWKEGQSQNPEDFLLQSY